MNLDFNLLDGLEKLTDLRGNGVLGKLLNGGELALDVGNIDLGTDTALLLDNLEPLVDEEKRLEKTLLIVFALDEVLAEKTENALVKIIGFGGENIETFG